MKLRALLAVIAAATATLLGGAAAKADPLPTEVNDNFDAVVDQHYYDSAQPTPPPCGATCQALGATENQAGQTGSPRLGELHRQLRASRIRTGIMPVLRRSHHVLLAAETFRLGWRIGSGIRAQFIDAEVPQRPPAPASVTGIRLVPCDKRPPRTCANRDDLEISGPGWYLEWQINNGNWEYGQTVYDGLFHPDPSCWLPPNSPNAFPGAIRGLGIQTGVTWPGSRYGTCNGGVPYEGSFYSRAITSNAPGADENAIFGQNGPAQDYNGQPYDQHADVPADPGRGVVDERLRQELESGRYPDLMDLYAYAFGTPGACDPIERFVCNPTTTFSEADQERCDLGDGGSREDPDTGRTNQRNHPDLYVRHQAFQRRREGGQPDDMVETELKKGRTSPPVKGTRNWGGWGWRHIHAKHGWTEADVNATRDALKSAPIRQIEKGEERALVYKGDTYDQEGARCQRWVIVADRERDDEEPEPPQIVTSYGRTLALL
jgi:hypothetical protein